MLGAARRLRVVRQPALHGRDGAGASRAGCRSTSSAGAGIWFAISGAVVALSIVALGVNGLNLGIDFKGGTQVTFTTPQPTSLERGARARRPQIGQAGAVIQGRGAVRPTASTRASRSARSR